MLLARALGWYPSSSAAFCTASLVLALTDPYRASARAAVDFETPALAATSMMVAEGSGGRLT
nr:hypothetical protein [Arthrobacter sp. SLBN-112]